MEDVTPAQRRNSNMLSDGFAGIIVAVGSDIVGREFKIGVAVAGVASGGWVNILDGSNQAYLDLKPENLWPISTATARKFGLYSTSSHGPYAIG
ncbi:hypothetical protein FRB97_009830 [Tulasnella sp. 331]|nr:hypothetical protein FRB97_009830 [Tulasnella sp. 331]